MIKAAYLYTFMCIPLLSVNPALGPHFLCADEIKEKRDKFQGEKILCFKTMKSSLSCLYILKKQYFSQNPLISAFYWLMEAVQHAI